MLDSVNDDAVEVSLDLEVKVLESLEDDAHNDVKQSVELQDEDGLDVVAVPEAQAHHEAGVGGD